MVMVMKRNVFVALAMVLMVIFGAATCAADSPVAVYLFPAGGQRGTSVDFRLGGFDLHEGCPLEMAGPGVKAAPAVKRAERTIWFEGPLIPLPDSQAKETYPNDCVGQVGIDADAALGWRRLRVSNSQGVSNWLDFVVGDLPEVIEDEIDGAPIPVNVQVPVTINGRVFPREDVDVWGFEAKQGKTYCCEVMSSRLGYPLDSHLVVVDPRGNVVADSLDHFGKDSFLRFTAGETGMFQVRIHDEEFGGLQHYVYRLTISDGPYVESIFPLGGKLGTTVKFRLTGQNLAETELSQPLPQQPIENRKAFWSDDLSQLGRVAKRIAVEWSPYAERIETESGDPINPLAAEGPVAWPTVLNGRIDRPGDVDAWRFEARKGDAIDIEVHAASLGSPVDSVITLHDAAGKELMANDDQERGQTDSKLALQAPEDGVYELRIKDQFPNRGGDDFGYRIWMRPSESEPDFELEIANELIHAPRAGDAKLKVKAIRKPGMKGPITLEVTGLPDDVTVAGTMIADQKNETELVFRAAETAKVRSAALRITGKGMHGDQSLARDAVVPAKGLTDPPIDTITLAVTVPTPFKITGLFETKYAARGSTFVRNFSIDRGGFQGPIVVSMAERQVRHLQGVSGPTIVVPADATQFDYPLHLAPWMEIGRTSRTCLMGVGEIQDADGTVHKVSFTSGEQADQIIVLVDPGQLDLRLNRSSIKAIAGGEAEIDVRVGRGNGITGPVEVTLVTPSHIRCVTAEPLRIADDESQGGMKLKFAAGLDPINMPLTIKATARVNGLAYTAEEPIDVVVPEHR
jgi:hypothetical protein